MKVVGLISGTSFDAIDAAVADLRFAGETLVMRPLGFRAYEYDETLRAAIRDVLPPSGTTVDEVCALDTRIGKSFATAAANICDEFGVEPDLVVSHGQTVYHWVEDGVAMGTLQLGQPAWISELTGAPVVSDLRSRDVAAGGHGAPLVSLFDVLLLGSGNRTRAALNLGGIANMTVIPPSGEAFAFDTGPASALIDAAVSRLSDGAESYDADGKRAARGTINTELLDALASDPYFDLSPPKSTGKELFNLSYLQRHLERFEEIPDDDLVATVTALTAKTVADEISNHEIEEVIASGGGVRNSTLLRMLREAAPNTELRTIDHLGVPSDAKEAYAFAVLGFLTLHGLAGTVPGCTGASRATVLGSITPGRGPLKLPQTDVYPTELRIETPGTDET